MKKSADPSLHDAAARLWAARKWIAAGCAAGLVMGIVLVVCLTPHYRVSMMVAPVADAVGPADPESGAQSLTFDMYRTVLSGRALAQDLIKDDAARAILQGTRNLVRLPVFTAGMTPEDVADYLKKSLVITPAGESDVMRVSLYHPSPQAGVDLLRALHGLSNRHLRVLDHDRFGASADHMRQALQQQTDPDVRRVLATRLMRDMAARLQALNPRDDYAARLVEAPYASPRPVYPPPALTVAACLLIGAMAGFVAFSLAHPAARPA